jgi:hypothetical protein
VWPISILNGTGSGIGFHCLMLLPFHLRQATQNHGDVPGEHCGRATRRCYGKEMRGLAVGKIFRIDGAKAELALSIEATRRKAAVKAAAFLGISGTI